MYSLSEVSVISTQLMFIPIVDTHGITSLVFTDQCVPRFCHLSLQYKLMRVASCHHGQCKYFWFSINGHHRYSVVHDRYSVVHE